MSDTFPRSAIQKTGKGSTAPLIFLIVVIAGALRLWSAGGDLWIDEVWSLDHMRTALQFNNPRDVAALFFHSNTHALNTLYMAFIHNLFGIDAPDYYYRILSVIAGIASVIVAARIGARWSPAGGLITALVMALSYPLIHYAGEARGYSIMIFSALSSYHILQRYLEDPTAGKVIAFVSVCMVGLLSHLLFILMQAGLGFWALFEIYSNRRSIISTLARLIPLFGIQFIAVVAFSAVAMESMVRGGDCCPEQALDSIRIMVGLSLGFNAIQYTSLALLITVTVFSIPAIFWLSFKRDKSWIMFGIVIVTFPLAIWILETSPDVIHRYFLLSALFLLVLFARVLDAFWAREGGYRIMSIALLVLFIIGNINLLMKFSDGGRGQYRATLTHILQRTDTPQRITVWPGFSVSKVLNHHVRQMKIVDRIHVSPIAEESPIPADWYIDGYLYGKPAPAEIIRPIEGYGEASYKLSKTFKHWGLSGDTYALYKFQR
ncbi:MAG: hypothetical protein HON65_00090 [Rhodospirillales bacterium]|jgi:hypothetical protein|nr:hypothetical protein [Rhodospirillales bacterium]